MKLPLDPSRIVHAGVFALGQDTQRRPAKCAGNGYRLRRSCAHGREVTCPICQQEVPYHELPDRVVQIDRHRSPEVR